MSTLSSLPDGRPTSMGPGAPRAARHPSTIAGTDAARTQWQIDPAASRVTFTIGKRLLFIRHLSVTGRFTGIQGTIEMDEQQLVTAQAAASIDVASIDTQQARRDTHLRSAAFFDVEHYPTMHFESRRLEPVDTSSGLYRVTGDLTIRNISREVQVDARYSRPTQRADSPRITLALSTSLNRRDFGLSWSNPLIKVADSLTVAIELQAVKQG